MKKEDFKNEAKKSMDDIFAKNNALKAKKDKTKGDVKAEFKEELNSLNGKKKELQAKYEELVNASDENRGEVKIAFISANDSYKEGLSKIKSLF